MHGLLASGKCLREVSAGEAGRFGRAERFKRRAVSYLTTKYRPILMDELSRWDQIVPSRREDIVQDYFLQKLLIEDLVSRYEACRGRMRSLIFTTFRRFVASTLRDGKRATHDVIEVVGLEEVDDRVEVPPLDTRSDSAWASVVLQEALERAWITCWENNQATVWRLIQIRIVGPIYFHTPCPALSEVAHLVGLKSGRDVSHEMRRVKRLLAGSIREVLIERGTIALGVEAGIRDLHNICAKRV